MLTEWRRGRQICSVLT